MGEVHEHLHVLLRGREEDRGVVHRHHRDEDGAGEADGTVVLAAGVDAGQLELRALVLGQHLGGAVDLDLLVDELAAHGIGEGVDVGMGLLVGHGEDVLGVLVEVDLLGGGVGAGLALDEDGLDTVHGILRGGTSVARAQGAHIDGAELTLRDHGEGDVIQNLRKDVLRDDVPDERLFGLGFALLVQVEQPAGQELGGLDGLVDLVPAVLDPDRGERQRALRRPFRSELLGHLGVDGGGGDEVRVGVHGREELRVREALIDALQEDLEAELRRHRDGELSVELGDVDVLAGELDAERVARREGGGDHGVVAGLHVDGGQLLAGGACGGLGLRGGFRRTGQLLDGGTEVGDDLVLVLRQLGGGGLDGLVEQVGRLGGAFLSEVSGLEFGQEGLAVGLPDPFLFLFGELDVTLVGEVEALLVEERGDDLDHLVVGQLGGKLTHGGAFLVHKVGKFELWWIYLNSARTSTFSTHSSSVAIPSARPREMASEASKSAPERTPSASAFREGLPDLTAVWKCCTRLERTFSIFCGLPSRASR